MSLLIYNFSMKRVFLGCVYSPITTVYKFVESRLENGIGCTRYSLTLRRRSFSKCLCLYSFSHIFKRKVFESSAQPNSKNSHNRRKPGTRRDIHFCFHVWLRYLSLFQLYVIWSTARNMQCLFCVLFNRLCGYIFCPSKCTSASSCSTVVHY